MRSVLPALLLLLALPLVHSAARDPVDPAQFKDLRYRMIGPHRGGRVTAVAGHRARRCTFYMGATGGGVWKTTDCGIVWQNVSDGYFQTGSIGAIDVADSDANVIYVGTGSAGLRSNVIQGRGVYKSIDAGSTWTFVGLREMGQIGSLEVHPQDPNVAYVAAVGQPFAPNPERGVFRTKDGGRTWQKVLFVNDCTGAVSIAVNPANPSEIYAGAWRAERKPWTIVSGGPAQETGVYKSTDGGDTWMHLTAGLPQSQIGKLDIDVSRSNPAVVYVLLEAPGEERGLYRSADAGKSFQQVNRDPNLVRRPFYYTYVNVDPKNENIVYVNNEQFFKSTDGGKTFKSMQTPHGDNHGMWINPDDPDVFVQSNDGGANVTQNGGRTWSSQQNQATAELYQVEIDDQFPYRVYGAQQDTGQPVIVPSLPLMSRRYESPLQLWTVGSGCETGPVKPNLRDPMVLYGVCKGEFYRMNLRSGQEQSYWVYPQNRYGHAARDIKYRFQRVSPFELSPHNPAVIYHGSQFVHRTIDEGVTWTTISPDLTANEPDKQGISGEPITRDITGEEVYSAIYAIEESPIERGTIWVGSNDGPVHVTRDGGGTWKNVTPRDLPAGGRVQNIDPSPHRKNSAYIAVYRFLLGDWHPYIYRTDDYGATWTRLTTGTNGIPADYPTRVVREDPDRAGLLYAGTEFGMFISFDNGARWQPFQQNLPVTPVTDIKVHRQDLVLSTMGRSFWILDNVTPLHQIGVPVAADLSGDGSAGAGPSGPPFDPARWFLFQPRAAYRMRYVPMGDGPAEPQYPPPGAHIDYYFPSSQTGEVKLEIEDAAGKLVRSIIPEAERESRPAVSASMARPDPVFPSGRLSGDAGMHRFLWDLRYLGPLTADGRTSSGPHVVPGTYQVKLSAGSWSQTRTIEIRIDPRVAADGVTQAHLEEQRDFNLNLVATINEARQLAAGVSKALDAAQQGGDSSRLAALRALHGRLITAGGSYPQPMLIDQFANIYRMTNAADQRIGRDAIARYDDLLKDLQAAKAEASRLHVGG